MKIQLGVNYPRSFKGECFGYISVLILVKRLAPLPPNSDGPALKSPRSFQQHQHQLQFFSLEFGPFEFLEESDRI